MDLVQGSISSSLNCFAFIPIYFPSVRQSPCLFLSLLSRLLHMTDTKVVCLIFTFKMLRQCLPFEILSVPFWLCLIREHFKTKYLSTKNGGWRYSIQENTFEKINMNSGFLFQSWYMLEQKCEMLYRGKDL